MKINRIHLENFGKFEDFQLSFPAGFSLYCGKNEAGKSTILDAIQMAFYGEKSRKQYAFQNLRKRYRHPAKETRLTVFFEKGDKDYRLVRQLAASNKTDQLKVREEISGREVKIPAGKEAGDFFFGLDVDAFQRSVFVGASQVLVDPDQTKKSDQLTDRLINLASSGDADVSYHKLQEALDKGIRFFSYSNGRKGRLADLRERADQLEREEEEAALAEEEKEEALKQILSWEEEEGKQQAAVRERVRAQQALQSRLKGQQLARAIQLRRGILRLEEEEKELEERLGQAGGQQGAGSLSRLRLAREEKEALSQKREGLEKEKEELDRKLADLKEDQLRSQIALENLAGQEEEETTQPMAGGERASSFLPLLWAVLSLGSLLSGLLLIFRASKAGGTVLLVLAVLLAVGSALSFKEKKAASREEAEQRERRAQQAARLAEEKEEAERRNVLLQKQQSSLQEELGQLLSAIGGLDQQLEEKEGTIQSLQRSIAADEARLADKQQQLRESREGLAGDYASLSLSELEAEAEREGIDLEAEASPSLAAELEQLNQEEREGRQQLSRLGRQVSSLRSTIREKYGDKKNRETIQLERKQLEEKREQAQLDYESLQLTKKALTEAMDQLQSSFGPALNQRTGEIFSQLTGGRYTAAKVDTRFNLQVEQRGSSRLIGWDHLSSASRDQAYFALRIAVAEQASPEIKLPLLLDDPFIYFDDERARLAWEFLESYAREEGRQVILFTAHQRFMDWAGQEGKAVFRLEEGEATASNHH